jgi:hypothetical protein
MIRQLLPIIHSRFVAREVSAGDERPCVASAWYTDLGRARRDMDTYSRMQMHTCKIMHAQMHWTSTRIGLEFRDRLTLTRTERSRMV